MKYKIRIVRAALGLAAVVMFGFLAARMQADGKGVAFNGRGWVSDEKCGAKSHESGCAKKCEDEKRKLVFVKNPDSSILQVDNQSVLKNRNGNYVMITGNIKENLLYVDTLEELEPPPSQPPAERKNMGAPIGHQASLPAAAPLSTSVTAIPVAGYWTRGWITDEKCRGKGVKSAHSDCAQKCVESGMKLVFVNDQSRTIFNIDNQQIVKSYTGDHVWIRATTNNGLLHVEDIRMNRSRGSAAASSGLATPK